MTDLEENKAPSEGPGSLFFRLLLWVRSNLLTTALLLFLLGMLAYQRLPLYLEGRKMVEKPAREFSLKNRAGKAMTLGEQKGKIVLLNFWATWCMPCRAEIPILRSLTRELSADRFIILAVTSEEPELVETFLKKNPVNYPILFDRDGTVNRQYRVRVLPTLVFVGADGRIKEVSHGLDFLLKWKLRYMATGGIF